jgi:hypothetical protein
MQSILPMLSTSPVLTFSIAPYFVWVMLVVLLVAGLAIAGKALRDEERRSLSKGKTPRADETPAGRVLRDAERPIAA